MQGKSGFWWFSVSEIKEFKNGFKWKLGDNLLEFKKKKTKPEDRPAENLSSYLQKDGGQKETRSLIEAGMEARHMGSWAP